MKQNESLTENDWDLVIERIGTGRCTPFLGAGVAAGLLPLGKVIAGELAKDYGYPLEDHGDLIKVSQYVAIRYDSIYPKERLAKGLQSVRLPEYEVEPDEPHRLLAKLPLPVYITTNYDDLMAQALTGRRKDPKRDFCRWNDYIEDMPTTVAAGYSPTVASPLVFHLHGHAESLESMVLTEDDYLEFLSNMCRRNDMLPPAIARALASNSLLFIGYQLADWNFRVILRGLARMSVRNIAVMPPPGKSEEMKQRCQEYLSKYYGRMEIKMYWGTGKEFLLELFERAGNAFD